MITVTDYKDRLKIVSDKGDNFYLYKNTIIKVHISGEYGVIIWNDTRYDKDIRLLYYQTTLVTSSGTSTTYPSASLLMTAIMDLCKAYLPGYVLGEAFDSVSKSISVRPADGESFGSTSSSLPITHSNIAGDFTVSYSDADTLVMSTALNDPASGKIRIVEIYEGDNVTAYVQGVDGIYIDYGTGAKITIYENGVQLTGIFSNTGQTWVVGVHSSVSELGNKNTSSTSGTSSALPITHSIGAGDFYASYTSADSITLSGEPPISSFNIRYLGIVRADNTYEEYSQGTIYFLKYTSGVLYLYFDGALVSPFLATDVSYEIGIHYTDVGRNLDSNNRNVFINNQLNTLNEDILPLATNLDASLFTAGTWYDVGTINTDGKPRVGIWVKSVENDSEDGTLRVVSIKEYGATDVYEIDTNTEKTLWTGAGSTTTYNYYEFDAGTSLYVKVQLKVSALGATEAVFTVDCNKMWR